MTTPFLQPDEVGRLRFSARPAPGPRFLGAALLVVLALGAAATATGGAAGAVGVLVGVAVLVALFVGTGLIEKHRVHDHALVLGPEPGPGQPFVVPWSTVDPGSLRVHRRANLTGNRYGPNGMSSNLRMAMFSTTAVSVCGLLPSLASPRRRSATLRDLGIDPGLELHGVDVGPVPLSRWVMGVRDPAPLARAIEQAMVDAGLDARGAAERALADPVVERRNAPPEQA